MIHAGLSAEELATQMGHKDSGVTRQRYVHIFSEQDLAANVRRAHETALGFGQSLASREQEPTAIEPTEHTAKVAEMASFRT
jgi:hypothetical protein